MSEEATGKAKGGFARAESLSPERRMEISIEANNSKKLIKALKGGIIVIGDIKIQCYVLEDETRVISMGGMMNALDITYGNGPERLVGFLTGKALLPFVSNELMDLIKNPIKFRPPHGGRAAYGYQAVIIPKTCKSVISANRAGVLQKQQEHIAIQCEIIDSGLGEIGIIGLVDEATGYQKDRAQNALAELLENFIAKELQPYIKTFQPPFWQELYRVKGKVFLKDNCQPSYVGHWINDIVYHRLAPEVLKHLRKANPKQENGRRKYRHFQYLTLNKGYPALTAHLWSVTVMMAKSTNWDDFKIKLDKEHPRFDKKNEMEQ